MNRGLLVTTLFACALPVVPVTPAAAAEAHASTTPAPPRTVSPGATDRVLASADECPTFSWSATVPADGYELALVESLEGADSPLNADLEPKSVLRVEVGGDGRSWTPSLERCPAGDGPYVWSVRALREGEWTEWSRGSWFTIRRPVLADREAIRTLLQRSAHRAEARDSRGEGTDDPDSVRPGSPSRSTTRVQGSAPALTVQGDFVVSELRTLRIPGVSAGDIETDTTFPSRALGRLRASRFRIDFDLLGGAGADLYVGGVVGNEILQLGAPGGVSANCGLTCADLDVNRLFVERALVVNGPLTFSGFTGYSGSGGAGFFEVPSATAVSVDDNASDCGSRPVMGVVLDDTDADQIGILVICGTFPD